MNGQTKYGIYPQWNIVQPQKKESTDEIWKHYAKWKKQIQKDTWPSLHKISRIGKSIEIEYWLVVARD